MSRAWQAVDGEGRALGAGPTPAAAVAAAPVVTWPLDVAREDGTRIGLGAALGPGGDRVQALVAALATGTAGGPDVEALAGDTPAGPVGLPVAVVELADAVRAAASVDAGWLGQVDGRRAGFRQAVVAAGRVDQLEAALHVAVLVGTEALDPAGDAGVDGRVASGARLWLLTGAVASALAGADPDPFDAWSRLVAAGWWPVGPSGGRLVVGARG